MIAYIQGTLKEIFEDSIIVDVCGIGYEIVCANPFSFQKKIGEEVLIHTYYHVREDAHILYGFQTIDEKNLFQKLISVSGIGPKSGLAIQGSAKVSDLVAAIEREDEKFLMTLPGVGKKTSRQIILDLKGKLTHLLKDLSVHDSDTDVERLEEEQFEQFKLKEVQQALQALGYREQEIRQIIPMLHPYRSLSSDEIIKKALTFFVNS